MKLTKSLLVLALLTINYPLYAGLAINPSRAEVNVKAGETYSGLYNVRNEYGFSVDIGIETKDWFVLPENKAKGIDVSKWLVVTNDSFSLKPGESRDIIYKVIAPSDASGVLVGMISFSPKAEIEQGVSLLVSVPVYLTVSGTEKVEWDVSNIDIRLKDKEIQVSCDIQNKGNVHLRPFGNVEIVSGKKKIQSFSFAEGRPAYPGQNRSVIAKSGSELKKGNYSALINIECASQKKLIEKKFVINKPGEIVLK